VNGHQLVQRTASALRRYGEERPNAADSERGICDWWLADLRPQPSLEEVVQALAILVEEGSFIRETLDDGSHIWRPRARS